MKCSMKNAIGELRAAGWRIYLDGRSTAPDGVPWDFFPWSGDDLIPVTEAAGRGGALTPTPDKDNSGA